MKLLKLVGLGIIAIIIFTGCVAKPKLALEYRPATTLEYDGKVSVNDFSYFPSRENVEQAQIPNTALGSGLYLDKPIGVFVADAVRREFRQAGISLKENGCKLEGEVNNLLIDDLGFSVDYISNIRYIMYDKNGKVLLDNTYESKLEEMSKFVDASVIFQNLNMMFSGNIDKLMKDDVFKKALVSNCKK